MVPDVISVALRGLGFVAVLQAGGAALFLALFGRSLGRSRQSIRRLAVAATVASALLLPVQYTLEAARMSGALSGMFDVALQEYVLQSPAAGVLALRLSGVALVGFSLARTGQGMPAFGIAGALLIAASFMLTGHTASHPERWILGPALVLHLLVLEFWFGALLPLVIVAQEETGADAARLVERFSRFATLVVPLVFVAGIGMTVGLLPDVAALGTGYGLALAGKAGAFVLLMLLASLNKWRLGPALAGGVAAARDGFRTSVLVEFVILAAVVMGTAVLTTFWSPEVTAGSMTSWQIVRWP